MKKSRKNTKRKAKSNSEETFLKDTEQKKVTRERSVGKNI